MFQNLETDRDLRLAQAEPGPNKTRNWPDLQASMPARFGILRHPIFLLFVFSPLFPSFTVSELGETLTRIDPPSTWRTWPRLAHLGWPPDFFSLDSICIRKLLGASAFSRLRLCSRVWRALAANSESCLIHSRLGSADFKPVRGTKYFVRAHFRP